MKGWDGRTRALLRTLEIQEKLSTLPVTICPQLRSEVWRGPQLYLWAQRGLLHNVMISDYQLRIQGSPKGMPREYKGQPQRAFHCPYPCRIKSYLTVVKSWGSGEATQVSTKSLRWRSGLWSVAWRKTSFLWLA